MQWTICFYSPLIFSFTRYVFWRNFYKVPYNFEHPVCALQQLKSEHGVSVNSLSTPFSYSFLLPFSCFSLFLRRPQENKLIDCADAFFTGRSRQRLWCLPSSRGAYPTINYHVLFGPMSPRRISFFFSYNVRFSPSLYLVILYLLSLPVLFTPRTCNTRIHVSCTKKLTLSVHNTITELEFKRQNKGFICWANDEGKGLGKSINQPLQYY